MALDDLLRRAFESIKANQLDAARTAADEALRVAPDNLDANSMAGFVAARQQRWPEAADRYTQAAQLKPNDPDLATSAGEAAFNAARLDAASDLLRRALALAPGNLQATYALAKVHCLCDETAEAVELFRRCIDAGKRDAELLTWLAQSLRNLGRADEALPVVREARSLAPRHFQVASLAASITNYASRVTPTESCQAHRDYGLLATENVRALPRPVHRICRPDRPDRIRVGFISPDFREHATAFFMLPTIEGLDRARFDAVCYYPGAKEDEFTARFAAASSLFRRIRGANGQAIAQQIADDRVHVLVDLAGHTTDTRMPVMALRPAPVQMTYLGYPNTTGLSEIDWRIVDELTDPPGFEPFSVERLARVRGCFLMFRPVAPMPEPGPLPSAASGKITFGSFSALMKYNDGLIDTWARVLATVPGSRLLLKSIGFKREAARKEMLARFARAGVDAASRLLVEGPTANARELLAHYDRVDIALDTFPYNGTTTICEASYMGVPTVSLAGDRSCARVGLSLLTALGLPDLVASDATGFVRIAAALAADPPRLASLRAELRGRFERGLGAGSDFPRRFGEVLERAWSAWNDHTDPG